MSPAGTEAAARRVGSALRSWRASEAGVAAVEFAIVLSAMVPMLLGLGEITLAVNTDRKVTLISRALADLSSRVQTITTSDMEDIFSAARIIMQPFNGSALRMVVTQMKVTKVGNTFQGTVDWSCARGTGAAVKPAGIYTVPTGFQTDASYYILIETTLPYTPVFGKILTGVVTLGDTTPWPIRNTTRVTLSGSCPQVANPASWS